MFTQLNVNKYINRVKICIKYASMKERCNDLRWIYFVCETQLHLKSMFQINSFLTF